MENNTTEWQLTNRQHTTIRGLYDKGFGLWDIAYKMRLTYQEVSDSLEGKAWSPASSPVLGAKRAKANWSNWKGPGANANGTLDLAGYGTTWQ